MPSESTLDAIGAPMLRRLFEHWSELRGSREFPGRHDLDPLNFSYALGHVVLIDVSYDPLRFKFRLYGTHLSEAAGYEMTGRMVDDLPSPENRAALLARCHTVVETGAPCAVRGIRTLHGKKCPYEAIWLPLSSDGVRVDMLMGALVYDEA